MSSFPCLDMPCADTGPRPTPLPRPKCPTTEPNAGDACDQEALYCEYGEAPAVYCRSAYTCENAGAGNAWVTDAALTKVYPCTPATPTVCPSAPAARSPCDASLLGLACQYPGLVCHCSLPSKGQPGWACFGAPENLACPEHLPNIGEGCAPNGIECDYAFDSCDPTPDREVFCYEGAWEAGQDLGCPL